jgi:hypothetical protein
MFPIIRPREITLPKLTAAESPGLDTELRGTSSRAICAKR